MKEYSGIIIEKKIKKDAIAKYIIKYNDNNQDCNIETDYYDEKWQDKLNLNETVTFFIRNGKAIINNKRMYNSNIPSKKQTLKIILCFILLVPVVLLLYLFVGNPLFKDLDKLPDWVGFLLTIVALAIIITLIIIFTNKKAKKFLDKVLVNAIVIEKRIIQVNSNSYGNENHYVDKIRIIAEYTGKVYESLYLYDLYNKEIKNLEIGQDIKIAISGKKFITEKEQKEFKELFSSPVKINKPGLIPFSIFIIYLLLVVYLTSIEINSFYFILITILFLVIIFLSINYSTKLMKKKNKK